MSLPNRREAVVAYKEGIEAVYLDYLPLWPELFTLIASTLTKPLLGFAHAAETFDQQIHAHVHSNQVLDQWFTLQIAVKTRLALVFEEALGEMARFYREVVRDSALGEVCDVTDDDLGNEEFLILLSFRLYLSMITSVPSEALLPKDTQEGE